MAKPPRVSFRDGRLASRKAEEAGTTTTDLEIIILPSLSDFHPLPALPRPLLQGLIGRFVSLLGV
jgi:hypothetical protein